MTLVARLVEDAIDPGTELALFNSALDGEGAAVSFIGVARGTGVDGRHIDGLMLDSYRGLTERSMRDIAREVADRFGIERCTVVHRHGLVAPGETIVFVATAARHRGAAFEAAQCLMDRLKTEAIFWKSELGAHSRTWIEPRDADRAAAARWTEGDGDDHVVAHR